MSNLLKSLFGLSVLSASLAVSAAPGTQVIVEGGIVHFTGSIVNAACAVSTDSDGQTVALGQHRTSALQNVGDKTSPKAFEIKLTDCDTTVSERAQVSFSGGANQTDKNLLKVSNIVPGGAGAATGVGIEITDHAGVVLRPDGSAFSTPVKLIDGTNTLHFSARYVRTTEALTPGKADADTTFTMQYN